MRHRLCFLPLRSSLSRFTPRTGRAGDPSFLLPRGPPKRVCTLQKSRDMIDDADDNRCAVNMPATPPATIPRGDALTWTRRDGEGRGGEELRGRDLELLAFVSFVADISRALLPLVTRQRRHSARRALVHPGPSDTLRASTSLVRVSALPRDTCRRIIGITHPRRPTSSHRPEAVGSRLSLYLSLS